MTRLSKHLVLIIALTLPGFMFGQAQPMPPDCVVFVQLTGNGSGTGTVPTNGFNNQFWGCQGWTLQYQAIGTGAITGLTVQSAPLAAGGIAGTWVTYAGTVVTGINPNTSSTGAVTQFDNGTVTVPFIRVLLTEGTFVGTLTGTLYGWRSQGNPSGGGGAGAGCPDPCTVIGPDAGGAGALGK